MMSCHLALKYSVMSSKPHKQNIFRMVAILNCKIAHAYTLNNTRNRFLDPQKHIF